MCVSLSHTSKYYKILHEAGVNKFSRSRCFLDFWTRPQAEVKNLENTEVLNIYHRPNVVLFLPHVSISTSLFHSYQVILHQWVTYFFWEITSCWLHLHFLRNRWEFSGNYRLCEEQGSQTQEMISDENEGSPRTVYTPIDYQPVMFYKTCHVWRPAQSHNEHQRMPESRGTKCW